MHTKLLLSVVYKLLVLILNDIEELIKIKKWCERIIILFIINILW